ncbi:MAG: hypothetical protein ACLVKK_05790 [Ruthenibacterium sp.]
MNGITVTMALVDLIPVVLFFAAAVILQRDLYDKMVKGAFALLATGSVMVLLAGVFKALWKILYALNVCDYQLLDAAFFPMQGPGFLLVFLALAGMFTKHNRKRVNLSSVAAVPVFTSTMPFVILQIIGCAGMQWCLFALALKMKRRPAAVMFVVAFVFMLGMGYLSATFDDSSSMHWLAQCVNIVSQGALLWGTVLLHRAGLGAKPRRAAAAQA